MEAEPRIVEYDPAFAKDFADLNYEWIAKYYGIEEHDHDQLDHPEETVIAPGGQIFFVMVGDEVAGTVAMIKMAGTNSFELAKMAVAPRFQGRKLGDLLMRACIDFAKQQRADNIILESNTKQAAAVSLYRKYGFVETPLDPNSQFVRANIRMELVIGDTNR
jgi:ribosomal protein S18 acetylase RimI-like enzyme